MAMQTQSENRQLGKTADCNGSMQNSGKENGVPIDSLATHYHAAQISRQWNSLSPSDKVIAPVLQENLQQNTQRGWGGQVLNLPVKGNFSSQQRFGRCPGSSYMDQRGGVRDFSTPRGPLGGQQRPYSEQPLQILLNRIKELPSQGSLASILPEGLALMDSQATACLLKKLAKANMAKSGREVRFFRQPEELCSFDYGLAATSN